MSIENIVPNILPQLFAKPAAPRTSPPRETDARAIELARRLITLDQDGALDLVQQRLTREKSPIALFTGLFEPAARALGDLWSDDECSELEVTFGLCQLQRAMRRISLDRLAPAMINAAQRNVLLVPAPGEPHLFCAALNAELLRQAGWNTHCEFPDDDRGLQELVADLWLDAVDLSLSPALRRAHWLPRVTNTVRMIRRASRNPAITVVVSGRIFAERPDLAEQIGADAGCESALQIDALIQRLLLARYTPRRPANYAWT